MATLTFLCNDGLAVSLTGTTGLVTIPTAEVLGDGMAFFGASFIDKEYLFIWESDQYDGFAGFVTVGYLPFLELGLCLKRAPDYPPPWQGLGDRIVTIRSRIVKESKFIPSILLGLHDPVGVKFSNSSYLVASRSFHLPRSAEMDLHLGYGVDWIKTDHRYQFLGLFGGISIHLGKRIALMLEHDSRGLNFGVEISIFRRVQFLIALLEPDIISGGINTKFRL